MIDDAQREYFRQVYERHADDVYRLCFSFLKNVHDSEDAVSMVFCKMMQKAPCFESEDNEKSWLMVTACNECKTMLRSMKRHPRIDISELPETAVSENYERLELLEAILKLDGKYSSVLYLNLYLEYPLTDIAAMTKQNVSTVRSRLFYGKKKLAAIIGGNDDEGIQRSNGAADSYRGAEKKNVLGCSEHG